VRIAYVVTRADAVGGATEHVSEMARATRARGNEVAIFVGGASGQAFVRLTESGAPVRPIWHCRHPSSLPIATAWPAQACASVQP